ncbi:MAG: hypothetical protein M0Z59_04760 [Nitrospiraceae bacterium]|nr:hypothetical protein [Nitrospiraceae bacterium]
MYHVQTEDCGLKNPVVLTLLYHQGAILASRKTDYSPLIGKPDFDEKIEELMKIQHKIVMKELIAGKHTVEEAPREEKTLQPPQQETVPAQGQAPAPESGKEDAPPDKEKKGLFPQSSGPEKRQINNSLDDILLDYIIKRHKDDTF